MNSGSLIDRDRQIETHEIWLTIARLVACCRVKETRWE
jgi:hypothetical protein